MFIPVKFPAEVILCTCCAVAGSCLRSTIRDILHFPTTSRIFLSSFQTLCKALNWFY